MRIILKNGFYVGNYKLKKPNSFSYLGIKDVWVLSDKLHLEYESGRYFLCSEESFDSIFFDTHADVLWEKKNSENELYSKDDEASFYIGGSLVETFISNDDFSRAYIYCRGKLYKRILLKNEDFSIEINKFKNFLYDIKEWFRI